jgi:hypothetical protein
MSECLSFLGMCNIEVKCRPEKRSKKSQKQGCSIS